MIRDYSTIVGYIRLMPPRKRSRSRDASAASRATDATLHADMSPRHDDNSGGTGTRRSRRQRKSTYNGDFVRFGRADDLEESESDSSESSTVSTHRSASPGSDSSDDTDATNAALAALNARFIVGGVRSDECSSNSQPVSIASMDLPQFED